MPLIHSKSKKAFKKNVETEMKHGKPQDQSLAIAYNMKKKKKYAKGGPVSAKSEARPSADEQSAEQLGRNRGDKPAKQDSMTSRPDIAQSTRGPKTTAIKHPKMVPSSVFSTRLRSEEDDLQDSAGTNDGPEHQPPQHDDEEGPDRQGTPPHKMKMMAEGGKVDTKTGGAKTGGAKTSTTGNKTKTGGSNPGGASTGGAGTVTITTRDLGSKGINVSNVGGKTDSKNHGGMDPGDEDDDGKTMMAEGGEINDFEPMSSAENDNTEHPPGLESDNDQMGDKDAMNDHMTMLAEGGQAEMEADHHDSIAAAIMAKRGLKRLMQDSGSADEDAAEAYASDGSVQSGSSTMNYADGGQVDLKENSMEQPNGYYARNKAALKENYDEGMDDAHTPMDGEDGDEREDNRGNKKDKIEEMRKRAMSRRNFNR